jgi:hypothetical protein
MQEIGISRLYDIMCDVEWTFVILIPSSIFFKMGDSSLLFQAEVQA